MQLSPDAKREVSVTGALALAQAYEVDCVEMAQALSNERTVWAKKEDAGGSKAFRAGAFRPETDTVFTIYYTENLTAQGEMRDPVDRGLYATRCDLLGNVLRHEIRSIALPDPGEGKT